MIPIPRFVSRIPILRGIFRVALTGYARLTRGRYMVEERMGLRLLIDQKNAVDRQIFLAGSWEDTQLETLYRLIDEQRSHFDGEAVFLDIGAHWGLYALLALKSGLFKRIVAFEPDPTNFAQLQANLFLNGAENAIEALQLAASDQERTFGLYLRSYQNRGATRLAETAQPGQAICRAVRVDRQLDFADKLLVMKMDVESHELEAIDGLVGLLARNRCILQVEIWGYPDDAERERRFNLLEPVFARHGMTCVHRIADDHFFMSQSRP